MIFRKEDSYMDERQLYNRLKASRRCMQFQTIAIASLWLLCWYRYGQSSGLSLVIWGTLIASSQLLSMLQEKYTVDDLADDADAETEYKKVRNSYHVYSAFFIFFIAFIIFGIILVIMGK